MNDKIWKVLYFSCLIFLFCDNKSFATCSVLNLGIKTENVISDEDVEKFLKNNMPNGIIYTQVPRGLVISVNSDLIFNKEEANINEEGETFLYKLGQIIKFINKPCVVEANGLSLKKQLDNLELSIIRAENIVEFLIKNNNINPQKIRAIGFGQMMPFYSNVSTKGNLDRRIDFVIINYD